MSRKRTDADVEQRRDFVIRAATNVFLRYGYARTTMAELATAAGLSRPALYEVFLSKEELFAEVVHQLSRDTLDGYLLLLPKLKSLRTKVQRLCRDWGTHGLKLAEKYPDAKDLFDLEVLAVRDMYEEFISFLTDIIVSESGLSQPLVAKVVYNLVFSMLGLKAAARDVAHMEELIEFQVDIFLQSLKLQ